MLLQVPVVVPLVAGGGASLRLQRWDDGQYVSLEEVWRSEADRQGKDPDGPMLHCWDQVGREMGFPRQPAGLYHVHMLP